MGQNFLPVFNQLLNLQTFHFWLSTAFLLLFLWVLKEFPLTCHPKSKNLLLKEAEGKLLKDQNTPVFHSEFRELLLEKIRKFPFLLKLAHDSWFSAHFTSGLGTGGKNTINISVVPYVKSQTEPTMLQTKLNARFGMS